MLANARGAANNLRIQCRGCDENVPSQAAESMIITPTPEYPFQQVVSDLCNLEGHDFLIYADRYSGWVEVERLSSNVYRNVRRTFLRWFATYGVPEQISTDGGPPYNAGDYKSFCENWGIQRRLSSVHYPQSNGRAEAAVKSAKRILTGNVNPVTGSLDTTSAVRAFMSHRNTPAQDTGVSPSVLLFGRPMRDHLPRSKMDLRPEWDLIAQSRESALAKRVFRSSPVSNRRELQSLSVGDDVQIQNQCGNRPKKWYNTGVVTEVLPNRQYCVMKDGSRRVTLRNRRFLRTISPLSRRNPDPPMGPVEVPNSPSTQEIDLETTQRPENLPTVLEGPTLNTNGAPKPLTVPPTTDTPTPNVGVELRRSGRIRKQTKPFTARMTGKFHE